MMNETIVISNFGKEIMIISEKGEVEFNGLHFTEEVSNALLSGDSFLLSFREGTLYLNNEPLSRGPNEMYKEVMSKLVKNILNDPNSITTKKIIEMVKQQR